MKICSCLIEDLIKRAQEDWLEKEVRNPQTGNMVKVKSLPPEERERYKPHKMETEKPSEEDKQKLHQEIEDKSRELGKPKSREERQFHFLVPQLMKLHGDNTKEFSHSVKKKMKNVGLSHTKDKKWLESLLKHFTGTDWKSQRSDFAYASNERIKKIANEILGG